jgi:hypothetical protein
MKPFYVIWRDFGGPPTVKFPTRFAADKEAKRLAKVVPGEKFHVLKLKSTAQVVMPEPQVSYTGKWRPKDTLSELHVSPSLVHIAAESKRLRRKTYD